MSRTGRRSHQAVARSILGDNPAEADAMDTPLTKRELEEELKRQARRLTLSLAAILAVVVLTTLAFAHFLVR